MRSGALIISVTSHWPDANRWNSKNRSLKRRVEYSDAPEAKYRAKALPKGAEYNCGSPTSSSRDRGG